MKLIFLLLLIAIGVGAYWILGDRDRETAIKDVQTEISSGAEKLKESIQDGLGKFSLNKEDIEGELEKSGKVVRQKAKEIGAKVADATADARTTAAIKGKLVTDRDLSALSVSVNTTDGVVTLSGTVSSHDEIGKAMLLALETEGVREVVSTLQVRQVKEKN